MPRLRLYDTMVVISVLVPVMTCFVGGKSSSCCLKFLLRYTTFLGSIASSPLIIIRYCWWVVGVLELSAIRFMS